MELQQALTGFQVSHWTEAWDPGWVRALALWVWGWAVRLRCDLPGPKASRAGLGGLGGRRSCRAGDPLAQRCHSDSWASLFCSFSSC